MSFSFPRSSRLLKKSQYDYVFQSASKIGTRSFTLLYRLNNLAYPRLGLIVSKKTAKRANERNRFKRVSRETFRLKQGNLPNVDVILLSRGKIDELDNPFLFSDFTYAWQKLINQFAQ